MLKSYIGLCFISIFGMKNTQYFGYKIWDWCLIFIIRKLCKKKWSLRKYFLCGERSQLPFANRFSSLSQFLKLNCALIRSRLFVNSLLWLWPHSTSIPDKQLLYFLIPWIAQPPGWKLPETFVFSPISPVSTEHIWLFFPLELLTMEFIEHWYFYHCAVAMGF